MARFRRIVTLSAAGVVAAGVVALLLGHVWWDQRTKRAVGRLRAGTRSGDAGPRVFSPEMVAELPNPVRRYFAFALVPGQPLITEARLDHRGKFATRPNEWSSFESSQHFTVWPPGFVWDASIHMGKLPGVFGVRVRDSYLDGEGAMLGAVASLVPVVDQHGTPEMASGSLARYLAESVWFPTALLPGDGGAGVTWTAIDDSTARATLVDDVVSVDVDFHFGRRGEIVRISGERFRDVNGTGVLTPWEGEFSGYSRRNGMMIPSGGEVAWLLPQGRHAYWRASIHRVEYTFAE